ncbi:MAG: NifU family protein [Flavobacteriales bacterium]|nr:NifU family protein [Flavobacteriales bacterium]
MKVTIKETRSEHILKFELEEFLDNSIQFEFNNIDEAGLSPIAQKLFYLPFVKKVYISGNFIAVERYNIVAWDEVKESVAELIETHINEGGEIIKMAEHKASKRSPLTFYSESTPNPAVMKFVCNKMLTQTSVQCLSIEDTASSPIAKALFNFPFVKEVFIDENYISVSKFDVIEWNEVVNEVRNFIKKFIDDGGQIIDESQVKVAEKSSTVSDADYENLDETSQKIVGIIDEYIKPAVASDGGNIIFDSFDPQTKIVKVIMQGACNGCPSSTITLKNGIETMLQNMLSDDKIAVEAV